MTSRLFDDQDDFAPLSDGARDDHGYLFGENAEWQPSGSERVYRYADSPGEPRRASRRRSVPSQGLYVPRRERERRAPEFVLPDLDDDPVDLPRTARTRPTQTRTGQTRSGRRAAAQRARARRRRSLILLLAVIGVVAVGVDLARGPRGVILTAGPTVAASTAAAATLPSPQTSTPVRAAAEATATRVAPVAVPRTGMGTFALATGAGKVLGNAGQLRRFQVAVEAGTGQDANVFAGVVEATLGDSRSWIAGKDVRFQRVPEGQTHDFTVYLASEVTSEKMCASGGLSTERYTSCRIAGKVIINLTRWQTAIPGYNAPLSVYRQYAINHEVGHQLGYGHEACDGAGKLAPVMQQQTYGLKGCVANPWPYVGGQRYRGTPISGA